MQICQRKGSFQCQQLMTSIKHWERKRSQFKREPLLHFENVSAAINFTGLSCDSERNFKFLAIDPLDVPYFINLGLTGLADVNGKSDENIVDPVAFIIDSQVLLSTSNLVEIQIFVDQWLSVTFKWLLFSERHHGSHFIFQYYRDCFSYT